jgi:ammonia channel protein AmtB
LGIVVTVGWTCLITYPYIRLVNKITPVNISAEVEYYGLDLYDIGENAY